MEKRAQLELLAERLLEREMLTHNDVRLCVCLFESVCVRSCVRDVLLEHEMLAHNDVRLCL